MKKSGLPIIFINSGFQEPLAYALMQSAHTNPNSPIHLISDIEPIKQGLIHYHSIFEYSDLVRDFNSAYIHISENTPEFESFCIARWFILLSFLKRNRIEACLHLDSDVMLYCNIEEEHKKFKNFEMTLSQKCCGHFSFINNTNILSDFCEFTLNSYKLSEYKQLRTEWQMSHEEHGTNISDMALFQAFRTKNPGRFGESAEVIDGSYIDHNYGANEGFEFENGRKKTIWVRSTPYAFLNGSTDPIRMAALHFQGPLKPYIGDYYTLRGGSNLTQNKRSQITKECDLEIAKNALFKLATPLSISVILTGNIIKEGSITKRIANARKFKYEILEGPLREAISAASGDVILLLTKEEEITENLLYEHMRFHGRHADQKVVGLGQIKIEMEGPLALLKGAFALSSSVPDYTSLVDDLDYSFHYSRLINMSFTKLAASELPQSSNIEFCTRWALGVALGYELWEHGYRFRLIKNAAVLASINPTEAELVSELSDRGQDIEKLITNYPQTPIHFMAIPQASVSAMQSTLNRCYNFQGHINLFSNALKTYEYESQNKTAQIEPSKLNEESQLKIINNGFDGFALFYLLTAASNAYIAKHAVTVHGSKVVAI